MVYRFFAVFLIHSLLFGTSFRLFADVKDDGSFFTPEEVRKVNLDIRSMKDLHKRDLVIETFRSVPPNRSFQVRGMSENERSKFFEDWAKDRIKQLGISGEIYVLICKEPSHLRVSVGEKALGRGLTSADQEKIKGILISRFKQREFDKGLQETVDLVRSRMDSTLTGFTLPSGSEVRDQGAFFTLGAIQKANEQIKSIQKQFKKEILFETFKTVPPSKIKQVDTMLPEARKRFFSEWINERSREWKKDGIQVLICKEPRHLEILLGEQTSKKAFPPTDRDRLRDLLVSKFSKDQFDQGLFDSINLIQSRLEENEIPAPLANDFRDKGNLFSPAGITQARREIQSLRPQLKKDIFVETYPTVPGNQAKVVEGLTPEGRNSFFAKWAQERMKEAKSDGIFILVTKTPSHLQILVGDSILGKGFTVGDREKLKDLMINRFKEKKFDEGLLEGIRFIRTRVDENLTPPVPGPVVNEVKDYAGLLRPTVLARSNAFLKEIKKSLNQDLVVETWKAIPPSKAKNLEALDESGKQRILADWFSERMKLSKVDGIQILYCQSPPGVLVGVGEKTSQKAFNGADKDGLVNLLQSRFRENLWNEGILDGLALIYDSVDMNLSKPLPAFVVGEVSDLGGLFTLGALTQSREKVKAIKNNLRQTISIETLETAAPGDAKKVMAMDQASREKYFQQLQKQRIGPNPESNFSFLICREPRYVSFLENGSKSLNPKDRKVLLDRIQALFLEDKFDQGLNEAVEFIEGTLAAPEIKDSANLFSGIALENAREQVKEIRRDLLVPLNIETFAGVLPAKDPRAPGIGLLLGKQPPQVNILVDGLEPPGLFTRVDAEKLKEKIQKRLDEKRFDDALAESTLFVKDTVKANLVKSPGAVIPKAPDLSKTNQSREKSLTDQVEAVQEKVIKTMEQDVNMPVWKLVLMLGGGFLGLWVVFGILRAIFGGTKPKPQGNPGAFGQQSSPQAFGSSGSVPPVTSSDPWAKDRQTSNPSLPPVNNPPGRSPVGFPGNQPGGYGANQPRWNQTGGTSGNYPGGYGAPQYGNPPPQQSGGGGFMKSVLGGMFGAAAGSWIYDSFRGSASGSANWGSSSARGGEPQTFPHPSPSWQKQDLPTSGGDFGPGNSNLPTGGSDFRSSGSVVPNTSGGDFGEEWQSGSAGGSQSDVSSSGGDFGNADSQSFPSQDLDSIPTSGGGDYGADPASEPFQEEFPPSSEDPSSGGDFGNNPDPSVGNFGGGDFGPSDPVGGGDFGGDSSSSGGDFSSDPGTNNPNSGGDF